MSPDINRLVEWRRFVWNSEQRTCFGRTGLSWLRISAFYITFYTCLTAFWALMMQAYLGKLDTIRPKWTLEDSLVGRSVGLGIRPRLSTTKTMEFDAADSATWTGFQQSLDSFLQPYRTADDFLRNGACPNPVIAVSKAQNFSSCTLEDNFGFGHGQPCIAVKLNKMIDWVPIPYNVTSLPESMPQDAAMNYRADSVYISCSGVTPKDKEFLGPVTYLPSNRIESSCFPYKGLSHQYLSQFVFVHFENIKPRVVINVVCKAWAANIKHNLQDDAGLIKFKLLLK